MTNMYLSVLHDREQSFEEFVWLNAGHVVDGFLVRPMTERLAQCEEWLRDSETELRRLELMSLDDWERRYVDFCEETKRRNEQDAAAVHARCARYEEMLVRVEAWLPPTPNHDALKRHMLMTLREGIDRDRREWRLRESIPKSKAYFRTSLLSSARRQVARAEQDVRDARFEYEEKNRWIDALLASVPLPMSASAK